MSEWVLLDNGELYHHGILGQKWGIRRYQNKDGTLTPAGKRRAERLEKEYAKLTGSAGASRSENRDAARKKLSEATDEEILARTKRLQLEKNYIDAERNYEIAKQQTMQRRADEERARKEAKSFAGKVTRLGKNVWNNVLKEPVTKAGKRWLTDKFEEIRKENVTPTSKEQLNDVNSELELLNAKRRVQLMLENPRMVVKDTKTLGGTLKKKDVEHSLIIRDDDKYVLVHSEFGVDELYHHGIKGQKWGVRRYQNLDGTLTKEGYERQQKRMEANSATVIRKGTTLYRLSKNDSSDANDSRMYVNTSKKGSDAYATLMGLSRIYQDGKAYTHKYVAENDLVIPSKRAMEKIELSLFKDREVQSEVIDSLVKKGKSREDAESFVKAYSRGRAVFEKALTGLSMSIVGASYGGMAGMTAGPTGAAVGAAGGGAVGLLAVLASPSLERTRALSAARVSYGDVNNTKLNNKLRDEMMKRGYNAMRDFNDRRAFNKDGKSALIVFDSGKNTKFMNSGELTKEAYGEAYARDYMRKNPKSLSSFDSLKQDGEKKYQSQYESGVLARKMKADAEKRKAEALEEEKKKNANG